MPARIVVVHNKARISETLVDRLRGDGYDVAAFPDALAAYDALQDATSVDLLDTRIQFPEGRSNGISLAMAAKGRNSRTKVLLDALSEYEFLAQELREFLPPHSKRRDLTREGAVDAGRCAGPAPFRRAIGNESTPRSEAGALSDAGSHLCRAR
jgi:CheY-like chemotaxis protein